MDKTPPLVVLHDLEEEQEQQALDGLPARIFAARQKAAVCKGCFGCWLQTPGVCILRDGVQGLAPALAQVQDLVIISRCLYGGFSQPVKQLLDRSIGYILPFFTTRNQEMHHKPRYANRLRFRAVFYNRQALTAQEQEVARRVVRAVGVNLNTLPPEVLFLDDPKSLREVLL
mgnify:CR=1 FL=1